MTYRCKTGSCEYPDLPHDLSLLCVCAAEVHGKITKHDLQTLREIEALRRMRENAALDGVAKGVSELVAELNARGG